MTTKCITPGRHVQLVIVELIPTTFVSGVRERVRSMGRGWGIMFEILSERDKTILKNAKEELMKDLKERPLLVLRDGDLISYELFDEEPRVRQIVTRYNGNEYIFTISDIEVRKHNV
jgi:hypothetical protein